MPPTWLTWLNPDDHEQLAWAGRYLARKGYPSFFPSNGHPLDGVAFIKAMERYEQDRAFRYSVDRMRAAWRQKQYRTRNGQQVAFQLPNRVRSDLARLAKARRLTKVETLRQVITDAASQHDYEKKELKKIKETQKKALHDLEAKKEQEIRVFRHLSTYLLNTLAEELHQRCCLEALVGEWDNSSLDDESVDTYLSLVAKRVAEVEAAQPKLKLVRLGGSTLSQRMQSIADINRLGHPPVDTQSYEEKDPS